MRSVRSLILLFVSPLLWAQVPSLVEHAQIVDAQLRNQVAQQIGKVAIPVPSLAVDTDERGYDRLAERLGQARLVGLGESTHGTREFHQFRIKLFKHLVQHQGFTHFLLEDMAFAAAPVEDFIQGRGTMDSRSSVMKLMWPWCTVEFVDFLDWARDYNRRQSKDGKRIHILGVDCQKPFQEAEYLADRLKLEGLPESTLQAFQKVLPGMPNANSSDHAAVSAQRNDPKTPGRWRKTSADLAAFRESHGGQLSPSSSSLLRSIQISIEADIYEFDQAIRDRGMALNVMDVMKADPNRKGIYWAHNQHVSKDTNGSPSAGTHLKGQLQSKYVVLGCFTLEGTIAAKDARIYNQFVNLDGTFKPGKPNQIAKRMAFRIPDAFFEWVLEKGTHQGVVWVSDLLLDPASKAYCETRRIRCGAPGDTFDPTLNREWDDNEDSAILSPAAFDAWFFTRKSTAPENVKVQITD